MFRLRRIACNRQLDAYAPLWPPFEPVRAEGRRLALCWGVSAAAHLVILSAAVAMIGPLSVGSTLCSQRVELPRTFALRQYRFQAPPPQNAQVPLPRVRQVPIPDPTPDEPEPMRVMEAVSNLKVSGPLPPPPPPPEPQGMMLYSPMVSPADPLAALRLPSAAFGTESYAHVEENPFLQVEDSPLSTFAIDVDSASYALVRRFLNEGRLPPQGAVRLEEMINAFDYADAPPTGPVPFAVHLALADCPWAPDHLLARIALKGREVEVAERPPANLVFLIDVSGSMRPANKLPLVRQAMRSLAGTLRGDDRVGIVVYAGAAGVVLEPTSGADLGSIEQAIANLEAGGTTHGSAGIRGAYQMARGEYIAGGVNRVVLATDGDFNVGVTSSSELVELVKEGAADGIFLTVLGVGGGNYKDDRLEMIADRGNGNYAYLDSLDEARRVLVDEVSGTLVTIAKDVKIQVEFNPAHVGSYRLLGYENRRLRDRDFNDDTIDAGELGAGHSVVALYELVPHEATERGSEVDPLRYQTARGLSDQATAGEVLTVKLRYKEPDGDTSRLLEERLYLADRGPMDPDFSLSAGVALFGMILRGSEHTGQGTLDQARQLAEAGRGEDASGRRAELERLIEVVEVDLMQER